MLTVDGRRPDVISVENGRYFEAQFFLYPPTGTIYENPYLSVIRLTLEPQFERNTCIDVRPLTVETVTAVKFGHDAEDAHPNMAVMLEQWIEEAPSLSSDSDDVQHVYRKSLVDLAALRFYSLLFPGESLPAAGLPWFMTIFGRDSLITSYQSLPFTPDLARTALRVLAARQ